MKYDNMFFSETQILFYAAAILIVVILSFVTKRLINTVNQKLYFNQISETDLGTASQVNEKKRDDFNENNELRSSEIMRLTVEMNDYLKKELEQARYQRGQMEMELEKVKIKEIESSIQLKKLTDIKQKDVDDEKTEDILKYKEKNIQNSKHKLNLSLDKLDGILSSMKIFQRSTIHPQVQISALHLITQAILYRTELTVEMSNLKAGNYNADYYGEDFKEDDYEDVFLNSKGKYKSLEADIKILNQKSIELLSKWNNLVDKGVVVAQKVK